MIPVHVTENEQLTASFVDSLINPASIKFDGTAYLGSSLVQPFLVALQFIYDSNYRLT